MGIQIHHNIDALPAFSRTVLTVGSFDGVHSGHQFILRKLLALAAQEGSESVVITFYPHPRKLFGDHQLQLITTLQEKAALLEQAGIEHLVVVPFSKEFAEQSPDDYIRNFLVAHFHPSWIVIGYDHQYGKGRQGNVSHMHKFEQECGFKVEEISKKTLEDIAISSTKIRQAIAQQDITKANQLLGHRFQLTGRVVDGQKIGNTLGFPTANIQVDSADKLIPPQGIYAVRVLFQNVFYKAMLYIGNRPTIGNQSESVIEVNIFDFNQDIYGQLLTVEFIDFLRPDKKFDSLEALQAQLKLDKELALAAIG